MLEVVVAVVRPQAAVVKAEHVVHPVGLSGDAGGFPERRRAPVVRPVGSAAPDGVPCQDLSAGAVVATLLSCCILGAVSREQNTNYDHNMLLHR